MNSEFIKRSQHFVTGRGKKRDKILSLDELLHTPPEAEMHRTIYTEMMIPLVEKVYGTRSNEEIYNSMFAEAQYAYYKIITDPHPELNWKSHLEEFQFFAHQNGCHEAMYLLQFVVYIYLKVRPHDDWEIDIMLKEMTYELRFAYEDNRDWNDTTRALFMQTEQIIRDTLRKRQEDLYSKAVVEAPQAVRTEAPQAVNAEEAEDEEVNGQLTNSQLVLLFQSILNLNLPATNRNALSRLIAAVSGRSADSIRQHTKREKDYDSKKVRQDVEVVANLLNELAPAIARRMRNDIADPPIQDPPD